MNNALSIAQSFSVGLVVGIAFFGGLWLTVRNLKTMRHPGLVIVLSSFLRIALAMAAFFLVSRWGVSAIAFCLVGFLAARFILIKKVRNASTLISQ